MRPPPSFVPIQAVRKEAAGGRASRRAGGQKLRLNNLDSSSDQSPTGAPVGGQSMTNAGGPGSYLPFQSGGDASLSSQTMSVVFKNYIDTLKNNGQYFFGEGPLSKDQVTKKLGEQMAITNELYQRIQTCDDKNFTQFVKFVDIGHKAKEVAQRSVERSGPIPFQSPAFLPNLGSICRETPGRGFDFLRRSGLFEQGLDMSRPRIAPVLSIYDGGWPSGFPPLSQVNQALDNSSLKISGDKYILRDSKEFCDFQSSVAFQTKPSDDGTSHPFRSNGHKF